MEEKLQPIVQSLRELESDQQLPKSLKQKIGTAIRTLEQNNELSMRVSRALNELEELTDDQNMQAYTRTQLFNIISMLEAVTSS
ncbi:UPF0147 family protein [Candidatus Woesearchaeota archaeon]|nr:UPF0147 family protein [Candidatus Woesearchaeota archaeon]